MHNMTLFGYSQIDYFNCNSKNYLGDGVRVKSARSGDHGTVGERVARE